MQQSVGNLVISFITVTGVIVEGVMLTSCGLLNKTNISCCQKTNKRRLRLLGGGGDRAALTAPHSIDYCIVLSLHRVRARMEIIGQYLYMFYSQ